MKKLFTEHPASVGESYFQHLLMALSFSGTLMLAALACLAHAILPFAFVSTGSRKISSLYQKMVAHRQQGSHVL